jgi:tetratricopeptide (TPR) repeat protein
MLPLDSDHPLSRVAHLLKEANRFQDLGLFKDAELLIAEARQIAAENEQARAEVDLFHAIALIEQNRPDEALQRLTVMLTEYSDWLREGEDREIYESVQFQRALSLLQLGKNEEARPILEEVASFRFDVDFQRGVHCYLGRCYHELSLYSLAKTQFELAQALGVTEDWQAVFHYYYGYTLYELKNFQRAKREFILCLQSDPSGPELFLRYSMLAATCRKLGERSEAKVYEEKASLLKR